VAISKTWKIVLGVVGVLVVLGGLLLGGLFYAVHWSGNIAQEVYGGPVPKQIIGLGYQERDNRMALFVDDGLVMILMQVPPLGDEGLPFSEKDVKQAIHRFQEGHKIEGTMVGTGEGEETIIALGEQKVHTLRYTDEEKGMLSQVGVLNLDQGQLLFIANWEPTLTSADKLPLFLMRMPALKNDSRMASSQEPASAAAE
jgi:hypothetical protein